VLAQYFVHGGCRHVVPEPARFAVHTSMAPRPVLGAEPDDQVSQLLGDRRTARCSRLGPLLVTIRWCRAGSVRGETIRCALDDFGNGCAGAAGKA
jgi:hypothetical protein